MSRIPPALARRIDRLARRAHAFHRAAHHPLCDAYRGELVRLGRRARLCRGCTLAACGAAAGALAGLALPSPPAAVLLAGAALFAGASPAALARPRARRLPKLLTRAAPLALGTAVAASGLRSTSAPGLLAALAAGAVVLLAVRLYRRRGPDRSACEACPERLAAPACSGLRPIARREAAFRRLAGRWLRAAGSGRPPRPEGLPSPPPPGPLLPGSRGASRGAAA